MRVTGGTEVAWLAYAVETECYRVSRRLHGVVVFDRVVRHGGGGKVDWESVEVGE